MTAESWPVRKEYMDENKRPIVDLSIGTEDADGGTVLIIEPVYKDLLPYIFEHRALTHVNLYAYPHIVVEKNSRLIIHSPGLALAKDAIMKALEEDKDIFLHNEIRALADIRNNQYRKAPLGRTTKILRGIISDDLNLEKDEMVHYDLLRLCLIEKFQSSRKDEFGISKMSKEELINLYAGLLEYTKEEKAELEPLKTLLANGNNVKDISRYLRSEVAARFFEGSIT